MVIAIATLLGAIIGSFIATIALRWPRDQSIARGRSACDACGAPIGAGRLVPLISFIAQRGRGACCGVRIDRVHPLAEMLAAAIGALSVALAPDIGQAIAGALLGWLLLTLALFDARHGWLPDRLTLPLAALGLAAGLADIPPALADRLIGGAVAFLSFAVIRYGYRLLRHREGMGGGDVKLFGAIGLWLGWQPLPVLLLGAALAGLLWAVIERVRGNRMTATTSVPFGVFLALGGWLGWLAKAAYNLPF